MLLRFINPKLGQDIFDKKHEHVEFDDDDFMKEVKEHATEPMDDTRLHRSLEHPEENEVASNPDIIERAQ